MTAIHIETVPGVGYTLHCKRGSVTALKVQTYDSTGKPALVYPIAPGKSAYIPCQWGVMTLSSEGLCEWRITPMALADSGTDAETQLRGEKGERGASAYEVWLEAGNEGSVEDFLCSLQAQAATADQEFNPESTNPQSGVAVASALEGLLNEQGVEALLTSGTEVVEKETPAGTDNATCNYFELDAAWVPSGSLTELSFRTGSSTGSGITTTPLYLAVWELKEGSSVEYELAGVSGNAVTQAINSTLTWSFGGVELHGRRLRCIPTTDKGVTEASTEVKLRVRTSASTDTSLMSNNGTTSAFIPKVNMKAVAPCPRFAPWEHMGDEEAHVTEEERAVWNEKADSSTLSRHTGDTSAHVTEAERATWNAAASGGLTEEQATILAAFEWDTTYGGLSFIHTTDGVVDGRLRVLVSGTTVNIVTALPLTVQAEQLGVTAKSYWQTYTNPSTGVNYCFSGHTLSPTEMTPYGITLACTWYGDPKLPLKLRGSYIVVESDQNLQVKSNASFSGTSSFAGLMSANGGLEVPESATLQCAGGANFTGSLAVSGNASFTGEVEFTQRPTLQGRKLLTEDDLPDISGLVNEAAVKALLAKLVPAGSILPSAAEAIAGYLLCDGAEVSREDYADLFAAISTKFGEGDGSTTFNLPDLRGRTLWGASEEQPLGSLLEAGLPNITGGFGGDGAGTTSGAFLRDEAGYYMGGDSTGYQISFDASRSNAIYGASDTVQPPALALNFFIKY